MCLKVAETKCYRQETVIRRVVWLQLTQRNVSTASLVVYSSSHCWDVALLLLLMTTASNYKTTTLSMPFIILALYQLCVGHLLRWCPPLRTRFVNTRQWVQCKLFTLTVMVWEWNRLEEAAIVLGRNGISSSEYKKQPVMWWEVHSGVQQWSPARQSSQKLKSFSKSHSAVLNREATWREIQ